MSDYLRPVYTPKTHEAAFEPLGDGRASPLPSHELARGAIKLACAPRPRRYLVAGLLPHPICGLIIAPGGTGKSFLTLSLAVAIAAEREFVGEAIEEPGSVAIIAAEDDIDELHRRLFPIVQHEVEFLSGEEESRVVSSAQGRIYVVARVGEDSRLLRRDPESRALARTAFFEQLCNWLCDIPDLRLVVLDPLSRFSGGEENSAEDATRVVEMLETLRKATGATVLAVHHANKGAIRGGDGSQAAARGSSALTDGVRWQAQLRGMTVDEAPDYGLSADDARRFVRFDVTKSNYAPPRAPQWLERLAGGVLAPVSLALAGNAAFHADAGLIVDAVRASEIEGKRFTKNAFIEAHGGKGGRLGVAEKRMRSLIASLLATGELVLVPGVDARSRPAEVLSTTAGEFES